MRNGIEVHTMEKGAGKGTWGVRLWVQGRVIGTAHEGYVKVEDAESWGQRVMDALWEDGYRPSLRKWWRFWE